MRRLIALLLAVMLLLCACGKSNSTDENTESTTAGAAETTAPEPLSDNAVILAFNVNDSLNPYTAASKQNQDLSTLLYESLVTMDDSMQAQMGLAKLISGDGVSYTIALRDNAVFSDGTAVQLSDVVYSFGLAKADPKWSSGLQQVASMTAKRGDIAVTLTAPNITFQNLLDFPIIKQSSAADSAPVGSGRYIYQKADSSSTLVANPNYTGASPSVGVIHLADVPDDEALQNSLQIGSISTYYNDLSDCSISRLMGKTVKVDLTNLVYVGANASGSILGNASVRRAISKAIDRSAIAEKAYYTYASAATGPLPSAFKTLDISDESFYIQSKEEAVSLLQEAGFTDKQENGTLLNGSVPLKVSLLVNEENSFRTMAASLLQRALEDVGFEVELESLPFADYSSRIQSGNYDLYMGEIRLSGDMDLSPLLAAGGSACYGLDTSISADYAAFRAGTITSSAFRDTFESNLPFIPLVYRSGVLTYPSEVGCTVKASISDVFLNIGAWTK